MNTEFELSTADRFGPLLLHKMDLAKPAAYYLRLHPVEAGQVNARLAAGPGHAETKAKAASAPAVETTSGASAAGSDRT